MPRYSNPASITVGVVGYGGAFNMGKQHLDQMKAAGMTPTAVVEIDASRLEVARKDFPGIETYATVTEMLAKSKVQLVVLITPHNTHADLALECLRAGRHVVCEKPFAITTAECDAMIGEAAKRNLVVSTYHNRHWDGRIVTAKQIIDGGAIGDVVRVNIQLGDHGKPGDWWRTSRTISGGILYDWGVHLLEYAFQIVTAPMVEVCGFAKHGVWADQTKWKADTNEDEATAIARLKSGQWIGLTISSLDATGPRGLLNIVGTKGSYLMDWNHYELTLPGQGADGKSTITTKGAHADDHGELYYVNVAEHLVKDAPLVITGEWSRRPIHLIDLAIQSAKQGRTLPVVHG